jgi:hypothetical protein
MSCFRYKRLVLNRSFYSNEQFYRTTKIFVGPYYDKKKSESTKISLLFKDSIVKASYHFYQDQKKIVDKKLKKLF